RQGRVGLTILGEPLGPLGERLDLLAAPLELLAAAARAGGIGLDGHRAAFPGRIRTWLAARAGKLQSSRAVPAAPTAPKRGVADWRAARDRRRRDAAPTPPCPDFDPAARAAARPDRVGRGG